MGPEGYAYRPVRVYRHRYIIAATVRGLSLAGNLPVVAATMIIYTGCVSDQIMAEFCRSGDQPRLSDELIPP